METFQVQEISINQPGINIKSLKFNNQNKKVQENLYSLIIGNNGSGKSRLLGGIANYYARKEKKSEMLFKTKIFSKSYPEKVIAITSSIADKFPNDFSHKSSIYNSADFSYNELHYNYLGCRNRANTFSKRTTIYRALDILFENYTNLKILDKYQHLFDYLNYEPIIKIRFKFYNSFFKNNLNIFDTDNLIKALKEKSEYYNISKTRFKRIIELVNEKKIALSKYLYVTKNKLNYEREIIINFSEKNINRIENRKTEHLNDFDLYKILFLFKKIDIIKNINVMVYKKDGSEFRFEDSSSGEANILTTMISLIPLLSNNCLILIDEPEISLHPQWQVRYIDLLRKILENLKGCHIIIATHSHFLATDLPPNQSSIIALERSKNGKILVEYISESTFGWSAESILYSVFNMRTNRNYYIERELNELLKYISNGEKKNRRMIEIITNLKKLNFVENDPILKIIQEAEEFTNVD